MISQIQKKQKTNKSKAHIEKEIQEHVFSIRQGARQSFYARAPWQEEHVTDQYYFDLTAYSLWRTAAELLPDYTYRDSFMRELGRSLYRELQGRGLLLKESGGSSSVAASLPRLNELLSLFTSGNFCTGYRLGETTKNGEDAAVPFLDEYDDQALSCGATVDCLISIWEPATLGASLQIFYGRAITICSRLYRTHRGGPVGGVVSRQVVQLSWETYFVDNEYRPNPKDYFADEQLLQFTIKQR